MNVEAASVAVQTESASVSQISPEAEAKAAGDLFSHELKQKISIGKDQSGLVPILQSRIGAEKVDPWNPQSSGVLRALWMTNSSNLTLDSGTFTIVEADTFAGEGSIDVLKPNEERLLSYAADPSVRVHTEHNRLQQPEQSDDDDDTASSETVTHLRILHGTMILTRQQQRTITYVVRNSDTNPKDVIIEHPAGSDWKPADGIKPEESTASLIASA